MKAVLAVYLARIFVVIAALALCLSAVGSELITQWNFNSVTPDAAVGTGTNVPSTGLGVASLVAGATATYATGSPSDPAGTDNSGWNSATYPAQGAGNKTRGVQFNVSTLGYERIMVSWDQRNSGTSSRYIRFQFSADGTTFTDGPVLSNTTENLFFNKSVDLTSFPAVNNNSNFAFRIVAEFEDTATGGGSAQYITTLTGGTYSPNGTWRFDMVTVSGEIFTDNAFPTISAISNQTIRMNGISDPIPFTVGDAETAAANLVVMGTSSDEVLIANRGIIFGGSESNRTVTIFPEFGQSGTAVITVTVTDEAGKSASTTFTVTVLPENTPPTISSFTNYHTVMNIPFAAIDLIIGDGETAASELMLSASSSNPTVIPDANLVFGGSGSNRSLTITPAAGESGNSVITVTVSDGMLSASRRFSAMVVPSANVLLCEPFSYADGSVNTNSGFRWSNHSGVAGQTQVSAEKLRMTSTQSEDINAVLIGAPYDAASGKTLYAGFKVNFAVLPSGLGEYFAHFRDIGGAFRARVFTTTTNVTAGSFRLGIANNSANVANAAMFPMDLELNTEYAVVVRYDVASGRSTLWVNPRLESDASVTASDTPGITPIFSWAFRQSGTQNGTMGTLSVDDLKVACSFSDAVPGYRLRAERSGNSVRISWPAAATDEGYVLESTDDLTAPYWQTVADVPMRVGSRDEVAVTSPAGKKFYRLVK